ncbi:MAG: hypothetical protein WCP21_18120 [Armatimonadota bacterium]
MSKLKMPAKGTSAAMMAELQAEHATAPPDSEGAPQEPQADESTAAPPQHRESAEGQPASPPPPPASREDRLAFALDRTAADELVVVTVRVSASLNHYMDEYVARRHSIDPKSKYRKQDAVAEAFAEFYAGHPLPPLPEDERALL